MTDQALVAKVGQMIWGANWQVPMAAALKQQPRTIECRHLRRARAAAALRAQPRHDKVAIENGDRRLGYPEHFRNCPNKLAWTGHHSIQLGRYPFV